MSKHRLFFIFLVAVTFLVATGIPIKSQNSAKPPDEEQGIIAGRNVNMVSGITLPGGDPYLQRQNEPSIAVSTRNPLHLLAGANDYRTVDMLIEGETLPGFSGETAAGDAWLGVFKSFDGGQSWISSLLPGFPQECNPNNNNNPLCGFQAAADPVVRAGTNGLFYYSGIAFNRTKISGQVNSAVFIARFIDKNNVEGGDSIEYIDTKIIATDEMQEKKFTDKPWIAVDVPKGKGKTVTIGGQDIPSSNLYIVYSVFTSSGNSLESEIIFRRSPDCGESWDKPIILSKGHDLNQGAVIAVDPRGNGHIYVAWRRFDSTKQSSAIIVARSINGGKKFHKVVEVATFDPVPYGSFDQPSTDESTPPLGTSFRTNSYPTIATDNKGTIYLAWSQRGWGPTGEARILLTTSREGRHWSFPSPIENLVTVQGHQFMPSLTFAAGKLTMVWYDQRDDYCGQTYGFGDWISDDQLYRHTIDVWAAQADTGDFPNLNWISTQISRYLFHLEEDPDNLGTYKAYQAQFNPPNYPLFKSGSLPFHGDYLDITPSPMFVIDENGHWRFNTEPSDNPIFHVTWTDNRDVRPPDDGNWVDYTPPTSEQLDIYISEGRTPCEIGQRGQKPGMRNQNIYTSRITTGIEAGSPTNTKALDLDVPRAFVIFVKNQTELLRSFRLTIANQPPGGQASFLQFDFLETLDVSIAPYSTISRQVFVDSTDLYASVGINIDEINEPGGDILPDGTKAFVLLNGDPTSPGITGGEETHQPEIDNPNIVNWFVNPNIVNPNIVNPNIVNPNIVNPNIVNPNIVNPNIVNPNIVNPNIVNVSPQELQDISITDVEWPVRNAGNTASSFTFKIIAKEALPEGFYAQLIVYKVHYTPAVAGAGLNNIDDCELKQEPHHEVLLNVVNPNIINPNIVNPNIVNPNIVNAAIENATFVLGPGEEAIVNLRIIDTSEVQKTRTTSAKIRALEIGSFVESLGGAVSAQSADSEDAEQGIEEPPAAATTLIISTSSLPPGVIDSSYPPEEYSVEDAQLRAVGGTGPYSWWIDPNDLPPGLSLDRVTGQIFGTPLSDPGTYHFTAQVTDSGSPQQSDNQILRIAIEDPYVPPPDLTITSPSPLPIGTERKPYGATLEASGGVWPYTWTMASGSLPTGLSLDSGGFISGMPEIGTAGTYSFRIRVSDSETPADSDEKDFTLIIKEYTAPTYTISGTVTIGDGGPSLPGVLIRGLPGAPTTDSSGFYSDTVSEDWSGTATPFKAGYYFDPPEIIYSQVGSNQLNQNYDAYPVELDHFEFNVIGDQTAGTSFSITITAKDSNLETITTYTDMNTLSDTYGTISPTSTGPFANGVWTGFVTITKAATGITITTTGGGKAGASSAFNVTPGALDHFDFDAIGNQAVGTPFSITITAKDAWGNTVTTYTGTNTLGDTSGTISPTTTGAFFNGTWTGNVTISTVQAGVMITTSGGGKTGESNAFNVTTGTASMIWIEDAADGTGTTVDTMTILPEMHFTVYAISRDIGNNFVENVEVDWSLIDKTDGIVDSDLVPAADNKSATFTGHAAGTAKIEASNVSLGTDTTGTITVIDTQTDDAYEDNDDFSSAAGIVLGTHPNLVYLDEDWYKVQITAADVGKDFKVNIKATSYPDPNEYQDLDFGIWNDAEKMLGYNLSGSDDETLYIADLAQGWYYIRINYFSQIGAIYSMTVEVGDSDSFGIGYISGTVKDEHGQGIENTYVELYGMPFDWNVSRPLITTDSSGYYKIAYTPGYYQVRFNLQPLIIYYDWATDSNYIGEYYDGKSSSVEANILPVVEGATIAGINAELVKGGTITGTITNSSGDPIEWVGVRVRNLSGTQISFAWSDENGLYTLERIPTGYFKVYVRPTSENYGAEWHDNKPSFDDADPVFVEVGQPTSGINFQLEEGGRIAGRVTDGVNGIEGVRVRAYDPTQTTQILLREGYTNENGEYSVGLLPDGYVKIRFDPPPFTNYFGEWYDDEQLFEEADLVRARAGETTSGIDAQLDEGGAIIGQVTDSLWDGLYGIFVICVDINSEKRYSVTTDADGNYGIYQIPPGDYRVRFRAPYGNYATKWYNDEDSYAEAETVQVVPGLNTTGIDAQLSDNGGYITGTVTDLSATGIEGVRVFARDNTFDTSISWAFTDSNGDYSIPRIPTSHVKVFFDADFNNLNYVSEFYAAKSSFGDADLVSAILGDTTSDINAFLATRPALTITTTSPLPNGELAMPYSASLEATGGREFYHWSLAPGSDSLPNGLVLHGTGLIVGTPTTEGTRNFAVRVIDSSSPPQIATQNLSITINPYVGPGFIISGTVTFNVLPLAGVVMDGLPGNPTTNASGFYLDIVDYEWSGTVTPSLAGYVFKPESRSYDKVTSNQQNRNYTAYLAGVLSVTTTWLLNGTEGSPYSETLDAVEGIEPYSWSLASGSLPDGLTLDSSSGLISATPTAPDTYNFTVRVTDSSSPGPQIAEKALSITIHPEEMISEQMITFWKFDEGSGTTAIEYSGQGVDGTLHGNATYTNDAVESYAVETYGQGWIRAKTGGGGFYFADEATIMAHVKIANFDGQDRFIWKLQYDHPVQGWPYTIEIHLNINGNYLNLSSGNGLKESIHDCEHFNINIDLPTNGFILGQYNHIALTIKDDSYKIFINGNPVASEPGAVFEVNDNIQHFWVMGADWSNYWLEGKIDELIVVNRILSPEEVNQHYNEGPWLIISGAVTVNGSPLQGVEMNGLYWDPTTNEQGQYTGIVPPGFSETVTPTLDGYIFDPSSRSYYDVTSAQVNQNYTAFVSGSLWVTTSWLPDGTKNSSYSTSLEAADGVEPYSWNIISGSLPNGLTLDSSGEISGTPTEAGDFSFTVRVVDSNSPQRAATQWLSLFISAAHQGFWTTTYPFGGNIHSMGLAIDPVDSKVLYATAENRGIFKTTDAGSSWTNLIDDPDWPYWETDYRFFIIHQSSGNYYLCSGGRIYVSSDKGLNWNQIYKREDWDINALDIAPSNADFIYFGTRDGEMFRTTDGGTNWSACGLSGLPTESSIDIITADPTAPSTVYAGMGSGIYKSTDSGDTWTSIDDNIDFEEVEDVEIDPFDTNTIYLHARGDGYGHGIFKSSTGEGSWTYLVNVGGGLWWRGNSIAIDRNDTDKIYIAIHESILKTIDGGSNWAEHAVSSTLNESIIIDPSDSQTLYVGTHGEGVYKSEDGGVTWNAVNNGIRALSSPGVGHSLEFDESNPNYIYSGSIGGGYRSLDGGATWEKMDFPKGSMTAILTHPDTEGTVYAVYNSFWISTSNGSSGSWVDPTVPQFCCVPRMDLGIASYDSNIILYIGAKHSDDPQSGVYRSDNGGVTWTLKNNGLTHTDVRAIAVHPTNHQVVFAGTESEWPLDPNKDYGLYKTTDGGEYWNYISCGLPSSMYIHQILIYPGDPNTMYLTGGGEGGCGLFKSENGGECWERVSNNCVSPIAVAPDNPDLLYIGHGEGFYVSLNGGSSRMKFNDGLPPRNPQVSNIHLDPTDPYHVFIGTAAGVYEATFSFDFMITTEWLPSGIVNESYSGYIEVWGGTTPYSFEIISGSLPDGLTLNQVTGEINGLPPVPGYWDFVVKATDSSGTPKTYTKELNLTIHNTYTLFVDANPAAGGSVSIDPDELKYIEGSMVDVSVTINPLYIFTGWSGDATGRATLVHVQMTKDKNLTANFALPADLPDYLINPFNAPASANAGDTIGDSVSVSVENQGANDPYSGDISVGVYLSDDAEITTSDILLWKGTSSITALPSGVPTSVAIDPDMKIPPTISAGEYYIGVLVDESDVIAERDETNNYSSQTISISSTGYDHLEILGGWPYAAINGYAVDETRNLIIIGHGGVLQILDVSDPSNPTLRSELSLAPSGANEINISGNYVYVANGAEGLKVIDILDSQNPVEIGSCDTIQVARSLDISGDYAYVTDYLEGLRIIDISTPASPFQTAFLPLPNLTRLVKVSGNYAYVTQRRDRWDSEGKWGLRIVDITDPYSPFERSFIEFEGGVQQPDIDSSGQFLFIPVSGNYLRIYDVSNPDVPFEVAFYEGSRYPAVKIVGNYAYVPDDGQDKIVILDISVPSNPKEVSTYWFEDPVALWMPKVAGDLCFIGSWYDSLRIVDFSDLNSPEEVGSYDVQGLFYYGDVSNDHAYLANYKGNQNRLKVLDISDLPEISETKTYDVPYDIWGLTTSGDHAYLAARDNGLIAINISDPSSPVEVGAYEDLQRAWDVVVSGNYAYVADGYDGLRVIDISTPSNPVLVSTWRTHGYVNQVALSGNYAYLADDWRGLRIIDVSDPLNPWEVGSYEFDGWAGNVDVSGGYAYVNDDYHILRIIDVSDPENPSEVSSFELYNAWGDIGISGHFIFVPDWLYGVRIIDVSNPASPIEVEVLREFFTPEEVIIRENYIYVVNRDTGFYVLEFRLLP